MQKISAAANDKIQSKNVVFTKDGMKVGVKEVNTESYVDTTQSFLVKAWNLSSWPGYKSRLGWNKEPPATPENGKLKARNPSVPFLQLPAALRPQLMISSVDSRAPLHMLPRKPRITPPIKSSPPCLREAQCWLSYSTAYFDDWFDTLSYAV